MASFSSINELLRCKFKSSNLLPLELSSLISVLGNINDQNTNFFEKKTDPINFFRENNLHASKTRFLLNDLDKIRHQFVTFRLFSAKRHVTCHVAV